MSNSNLKASVSLTLFLFGFLLATYLSLTFLKFIITKYVAVEPDKYTLFVDILTILLAIVAFLWYFLSKDIEQRSKILGEKTALEIRESCLKERLASRSETNTTISLVLWNIYTQTKDEYYLNKAILNADKAVKSAGKIDSDRFPELIYAENNFSYFLAEKQMLELKEGREIDPIDKENAIRIKNKLWNLMVSDEFSKLDLPNLQKYKLKETCAWIIYCFAKNEDEKQKARQIIKSLESVSPGYWFKKAKERYSI